MFASEICCSIKKQNKRDGGGLLPEDLAMSEFTLEAYEPKMVEQYMVMITNTVQFLL